MTSYIRHITLNTGAQRDVHRDDIYPGTLEGLRMLIHDMAAATGPIPIPRMPDMWARAEGGSKCLTISIYAETQDPDDEIIRVHLARHQRCSAALWRSIHESQLAVTDVERPPALPWSATLWLPAYQRIAGADAMSRMMMEAMGPSLAWAWLLEAEAGDVD